MPAIPRRTGVPLAQKLAKELCRVLAKYRTIILLVSGDDPALEVILDNAAIQCALLNAALEEIRDYGD